MEMFIKDFPQKKRTIMNFIICATTVCFYWKTKMNFQNNLKQQSWAIFQDDSLFSRANILLSFNKAKQWQKNEALKMLLFALKSDIENENLSIEDKNVKEKANEKNNKNFSFNKKKIS